MMTGEIGEYIGDRLGKFIDSDHAQAQFKWGAKILIRASLDVHKLLTRALRLRSMGGTDVEKLSESRSEQGLRPSLKVPEPKNQGEGLRVDSDLQLGRTEGANRTVSNGINGLSSIQIDLIKAAQNVPVQVTDAFVEGGLVEIPITFSEGSSVGNLSGSGMGEKGKIRLGYSCGKNAGTAVRGQGGRKCKIERGGREQLAKRILTEDGMELFQAVEAAEQPRREQ
ncbi:UNVERIFIED_CONTAM: hypothetical protein Slati_4195200 [Sesamum latifolium]|uniref:Uncharacterized protein n=1 Tax=Sesamum latifolium TaxID=2727402 RepID=A0AAW2TA34_9LAMI